MPKFAATLLVALILSGTASLLFLYVEKLRQYFFIPLAVETVLCIVAYFYGERYEINNSEKYLKNYKEYCSDMYNWLQNM